MNSLPKEAIIEYQNLYQKVYGRKISFATAMKNAKQLLNLVLVIEKRNEDEDEKHRRRLHHASQKN